MGKRIVILAIMVLVIIFILPHGTMAGDRFVDNGDGTVTDQQQELMWGTFDNQGDISWQEAKRWVTFTFPYTIEKNYDNWRLPTTKELQNLFTSENAHDYKADCGKPVHIIPEIHLSCSWVWSSENKSITAKVFNFSRGYSYMDRMATKRGFRALAVRDIK
ncbi:MAG TPA: DUF1566 domain-containing protein [Desulfobulbaceae bacterium]|nr:DUF1566 domain-containing protein [Desulfobulbaceae bacterium]